jgi:CRP-like cAMP-binding protein
MSPSSASDGFVQFAQRGPYNLALSDEEARLFAALPVTERFYPAGTLLVEEEKSKRASLFIVSGWALSYKSMASGDRLVTDLLQRGDFIGSYEPSGKAQRSVQAKTDVVAFEIENSGLPDLPKFWNLIFSNITRNYCIMEEHLANVSRRAPLERSAWLFLEIAYRHEQAGLGSGGHFTLPFTQSDLGDALGLTAIHLNRLLRVLRERHCLRFQHRTAEILDRKTMVEITGFDPTYLSFMP